MVLGEIRYYDTDWIGLAQNKERWWAVVNAVNKYPGCINAGKFLIGYITGVQNIVYCYFFV
jgi:hypothetical protein